MIDDQGGFFMAKWSEGQKKWGLFILFLIGLFLVFKYIVPLFWPFILAFIIVAPIEPILEKLSLKLHIGKGILAGIVVTLILAVFLAAGILLGSYAIRLISQFVEYADDLEVQLNYFTDNLCKLLEQQLGLGADHVNFWINHQIDQVLAGLQDDLFPKVMNKSVCYIIDFAKGMIFIVILWIAAVLLAKDFNKIKEKFRRNYYVRYTKNELKKLGKFIRTFLFAQIIIMSSISVICFIGFILCRFRIGQAAAVSILTGALDAMPFLGTGIIMLPIALWMFIVGDKVSFFILLVTFIISVIVRELLEPRLIGGKMGLWPVAILMSVYVGAKVFGFFGVILGPIYLIIAADWYFNAEISQNLSV